MERYAAGIDVSHWQGVISWDALAAAGGVQFAYIKATDGEHGLDPQFGRNWQKAKAAKIPRGAYHFFRPVDVDSQIRSTIAALGAPGDDPGELAPALDVEVGPLDKAQFDNVLQWLEAIEAFYNRIPVLYMDRWSVHRLWIASSDKSYFARFTRCPLWLADYTSVATPPIGFPPWDTWTFWQYSPQGSVAGLGAAVDLDYYHGPDLAAPVPARVAT